jgi:hypothetical protein
LRSNLCSASREAVNQSPYRRSLLFGPVLIPALSSLDERLPARQSGGVFQRSNATRRGSRQVWFSRSAISGHCSSSASPHLEATLDPMQVLVGAVESFLDPGDPADKPLEIPPHLGLVGRDPCQGFEHGVVLFVGHGANPASARTPCRAASHETQLA